MCVRIFFEERDNEGIIIRCVEPIMYNEHVVSFRQKPLSIVLLPLLQLAFIINIFLRNFGPAWEIHVGSSFHEFAYMHCGKGVWCPPSDSV